MTNPLAFCLSEETREITDRLLGEFLESCMEKNDLAVANGMITAAAIIVATHCQTTGDDFAELSYQIDNQFKRALKIAGERIKR